jgi:hypothetical protein
MNDKLTNILFGGGKKTVDLLASTLPMMLSEFVKFVTPQVEIKNEGRVHLSLSAESEFR